MASRRRGNLEHSKPQVAALLGVARGLMLTQGHLTSTGIELVFESGDRRVELQIVPHVYASNRNILDPINDLTVSVEVKDYRLAAQGNGSPAAEKVFDERTELPFSTWFDETNYL